ncbi:MAG: DUF3679 domain-containing protein [Bacilli bacterium]
MQNVWKQIGVFIAFQMLLFVGILVGMQWAAEGTNTVSGELLPTPKAVAVASIQGETFEVTTAEPRSNVIADDSKPIVDDSFLNQTISGVGNLVEKGVSGAVSGFESLVNAMLGGS